MSRVVEQFYSVAEAAERLSVCTKTVRRWLAAGELGRQIVNLGTAQRPDFRLPASSINTWLARRRVFFDEAGEMGVCESAEPGVAARSVGELRRKAAAGG